VKPGRRLQETDFFMLNILFLSGIVIFLAVTLVTLALVLKAGRVIRQAAIWLTLLGSLLFMGLALDIIATNQPFRTVLYRIASLQFSFVIDDLAAFFILIISLVSSCVSVYSLRYIDHGGTEASKNFHVSMMAAFMLSMLLLVAGENSFVFIFFWETMSLTSFFLVMSEWDNKETRKSGLFYFAMTQMSTIFLLFGFLGIYRITGSFDIRPLTGASPAINTVLFLSLFTGFSIKAGVMPFHKWLPYAHSASPSNISALMSGVMIKVAIYGMVRYILLGLNPSLWWGIMILVFGTFSALLGVIYVLKEHDIKKLLAYCSIENIGVILIGIGLSIIFQSHSLPELALLSLVASLFHTLNHALFKSLLFLTAGAVVNATGTRNIEKMGGLIKTMPYTGILFLIGSVSIAGLPPFNGFVSELMIFQAFLQSFIITSPFMKILLFLGLSLFALTSALAAAAFVKAFGIMFLATPRSDEARKAHEVSPFMLASGSILAVLCAGLGIFSYQIFSVFGYHPPIPDLMVVSLFLLAMLGFVWLVLLLVTTGKTRTSETWGCGITSQNSRMEYTATGFSEPILTIFRPIYRTNRKVTRTFSGAAHAIFKSGNAEILTFKFFEERLYLPVARFAHRLSTLVSNLQDVDLDVYILYSFIAIVILILIIGWII